MKSKIKKAYLLEYIDNAKDFEYVEAGCCYHGDPMLRWKARIIKDHKEVLDHAMETWCREYHTLQHVKIVDGIKSVEGEAMAEYLFYAFRSDIYDAKMSEQIWVDGELVHEEDIELPRTFFFEFPKLVNKDTDDLYRKAKAERDRLASEVNSYRQFLDKYKLTDVYRKEIV
jgi:hypothetical protein